MLHISYDNIDSTNYGANNANGDSGSKNYLYEDDLMKN